MAWVKKKINQEIGEKPHTQYQRWKKNIGKSVEDHWEEIMRKYTWLSSMLKTSTLEQEMLNTISPSAHILRFRLNERTNKRKRKHRLFSMSTHKSHTLCVCVYIYGRNLKSSIFFFVCCQCWIKKSVCAHEQKKKHHRIDTGSIRCYHICTWDLLKITMLHNNSELKWKKGIHSIYITHIGLHIEY